MTATSVVPFSIVCRAVSFHIVITLLAWSSRKYNVYYPSQRGLIDFEKHYDMLDPLRLMRPCVTFSEVPQQPFPMLFLH